MPEKEPDWAELSTRMDKIVMFFVFSLVLLSGLMVSGMEMSTVMLLFLVAVAYFLIFSLRKTEK